MSAKGDSSRERMLSALSVQRSNYVPCCFMIFSALREQCRDEFEFVERQIELGLDARVSVGDLPIRFSPEVSVKEWKEQPHGEEFPLLHREYHTPAGVLSAVVRQTDDWPYGDHVPLFDDYLAPRSQKFLITEQADLKSLRYLLVPPTDHDIKEFQIKAAQAKQFASDRGLLFCGGWNSGNEVDTMIGGDAGTMGIDALMWLCGAVDPLIWAFDQPYLLEELVDIIAVWNRRRMEIILDTGVDLLIKRGWYEGTDFWSPPLYKHYTVPVLREDITLTHQAGARFGYILTSGMMPLLDDLLEVGTDAIIGIDPVQGKGTDLRALGEVLGGRICLWGGINGFLTIEQGTAQGVKRAVEEAMDILGPTNGFILSPVDNVRDNSDHAWQNVRVMIETWKAFLKEQGKR